MKPFQLDKVLDHRKRLEDIAANRLFEARRQTKLVREKLYRETKNLELLITRTEELQSRTIRILDLINYENQIDYLKNNIHAIENKLQEKTETMQKEHQTLLERSKGRQIMESLKEKQNRSWKEHLDKSEVSMLDEIAIVRHDKEPEY
jgi:flagellar export protein FliJ